MKYGKECVCGRGGECQGVSAAFALLKDPRRGYVQLPQYTPNPRSYAEKEMNDMRAAYLRHLRRTEQSLGDSSTPRFVALHHFHPVVVQKHSEMPGALSPIPKTIKKVDMKYLKMTLGDEDRVRGEDGRKRKVFYFVPTHRMDQSKEDLKHMIRISRLYSEARAAAPVTPSALDAPMTGGISSSPVAADRKPSPVKAASAGTMTLATAAVAAKKSAERRAEETPPPSAEKKAPVVEEAPAPVVEPPAPVPVPVPVPVVSPVKKKESVEPPMSPPIRPEPEPELSPPPEPKAPAVPVLIPDIVEEDKDPAPAQAQAPVEEVDMSKKVEETTTTTTTTTRAESAPPPESLAAKIFEQEYDEEQLPSNMTMESEEGRKFLFRRMCNFEKKREGKCAALVNEFACRWRASLEVMQAGIFEVARAERIVGGTALANQAYAEAMQAMYDDVYLDGEGNAVTDPRKQKKLAKEREGLEYSIDTGEGSPVKSRKEAHTGNPMLGSLVDSHAVIAEKFTENYDRIEEEVVAELANLKAYLKEQMLDFKRRGDPFIRDIQGSETEVQTAYGTNLVVLVIIVRCTPLLTLLFFQLCLRLSVQALATLPGAMLRFT